MGEATVCQHDRQLTWTFAGNQGGLGPAAGTFAVALEHCFHCDPGCTSLAAMETFVAKHTAKIRGMLSGRWAQPRDRASPARDDAEAEWP